MEQWQRCSYNHCVQIKDRSCFTFAIKKSGNRFGQLGRKSQKKNDDKSPQQVVLPVDVEIQDVADVAAGGSKDSGHTLVVTGHGQVYAFGCDRWQQLGLGGNTTNAGYTWKKGKIWHHQPQLISALTDVVAVAAGDDHSVALTRKGEVWTWGRGEHGQLGQPGRHFLCPPTKSLELSNIFQDDDRITENQRSIRAYGNCTGIFSSRTLLKHVGKCPIDLLEQWNKMSKETLINK